MYSNISINPTKNDQPITNVIPATVYLNRLINTNKTIFTDPCNRKSENHKIYPLQTLEMNQPEWNINEPKLCNNKLWRDNNINE